MKKNYKIILILVIAVIMAVLASLGIISYLSPKRATIYVFKSSYAIGTQITSDMLIPVQVDSSIVVAGRKANVSEQIVTSADIKDLLESGDSLKVSVGEGTPLMRSLLSIAGGNRIMMTMTPSKVAVTINVDNTTGVTQELYSGASVNVYVTAYSGSTFLLFEDMRVLDITRNKNNGSLSNVTLEVTNEQAVKLINSAKNGSIHLGLINESAYQFVEGTSEILVNPDQKQTVETTAEPEPDDLLKPDIEDEMTYTDDVIEP